MLAGFEDTPSIYELWDILILYYTNPVKIADCCPPVYFMTTAYYAVCTCEPRQEIRDNFRFIYGLGLHENLIFYISFESVKGSLGDSWGIGKSFDTA